MIDKTIIVGAGAGIGVAQTVILRQYGNIPYIGDVIPYPWGKWSTFGNILIGGICFGLTQYTDKIRNTDLNSFLKVYGMSTLLGGIINGIFPSTASPMSGSYVATLPGGRNGHISHSYYPGYQGVFVDRPATRAKGFGSDVTKNPMAAIPTKIGYDRIVY